ncbi:MAG TPA: flagellar brake domain-containing protein [Ruminiclostridium sp.]|nr:flagellar brake domain-containing protein [Ruminiclostridium sp.]
MNANHIIIGTKLEIEIPEYNKNSTTQSSGYISQLVDVVDVKTITIVAPMSEGRLKYLSSGLNIIVYFLNKRQELMHFNATVKDYKKLGPLETFELTITSEFEKIQRRMHYRLDSILACKYIFTTDRPLSNQTPEFKEIPETELKDAYTKNISGSGLCLTLEDSVDSGTLMDITIELEGMASIRVLAEVIRSIKIQHKKYEVGLNFIYISPQDSNILTRFIFEKQRLMLKNNPPSRG